MADLSKGAGGEILAARFLRDKGYTLLAGNYHTRFGEIDIIAQNKHYIVFVEVKARSEDALYVPREAVTAAKQNKIIRSAALFLKEHPCKLQPRFDVIEVITAKDAPMQIVELNHLMAAYETGDLHAAF